MNVTIKPQAISISVDFNKMEISSGSPIARSYIPIDPYTGDYEITPTTSAIVLETDGKRMTDDLTVNPIPSNYVDTSDATLDSGDKMLSGNTAYADGVEYIGSISIKTSSDVDINAAMVTIPSGYYAEEISLPTGGGIVITESPDSAGGIIIDITGDIAPT